MSKFFHLTKRTPQSPGKKRVSTYSGFDFKIIKVMICTLIFFFGVGYLLQVNSLATRGYKIKELEKRVEELKQEKSDLELETLSLQSMSAVQDKVNNLGMVVIEKADYLQPTPVAIAR